MKKLKRFFKVIFDVHNLMALMAGLALLSFILIVIYSFFFSEKATPKEDFKSFLRQLDSFWGGAIVVFLLVVLDETRKEGKNKN
jgi:cell division protein FtsW (lipid II flippase)